MRVVAGPQALMPGFRPLNNIPECNGIYGVRDSGLFKPIDCLQSQSLNCFGLSGIESGGIQVLRPLLNFDKSRLIATCEELGTQWVEDETNKDLTITPRNAVRHIFSNYQMPKALQKDSLFKLLETKEKFDRDVNTLAEEFFAKMRLRLDLRIGAVKAVFPTLASIEGKIRASGSTYANLTTDAAMTVAAALVRRVVSLVSPEGTPAVSKLVKAAEIIFNPSNDDSGGLVPFLSRENESVHPSLTRFTLSNTMFSPEKYAGQRKALWLLSRQPFASRYASSFNPKDFDDDNIVEATNGIVLRFTPGQSQGFALWDGRYWMQINNPSPADLLVRPFTKRDSEQLRALLSNRDVILKHRDQSLYSIDTLLGFFAGGNLRYTLPVIASKDSEPDAGAVFDVVPETKELPDQVLSRVVAFPTLNLRVEGRNDRAWPYWVNQLQWEVRYKKIELGAHSVEDVLEKMQQNTKFRSKKPNAKALRAIPS